MSGGSKQVWVFAVGATAEDAIRGFGDSLGNVPAEVAIDHLEEGDGEWEARFRLDGTGMKAGGRIVPGGYVLTDWS